ncbi:MAG: RecX family transcriptional regulator [Bacillota bacterium]|nr:RecX family transcriptional regulator [Bacillota bacterium]
MKITKVIQQKNDPNRFSLFSEGQYVGSATVENLSPYGYGEFEISDEDFQKLMDQDDFEKALSRSIKYVARAMKTSKEVRDYLYKHKIDPQIHDQIIERLEDLGLIDDQRYLEMYLEEKFSYGLDGSMKIKNKLFLKGFSSSQVDALLYKYRDQEEENLKKLIENNMNSSRAKDKNKMIRFLMNKGYHYGMIADIIGSYYNNDW